MYRKDSLYSLNKKDPDAIVYLTADGTTVRVTRDDFQSDEDFLVFKAWSDENYHKEDNLDVNEDRRRVAIDDLSEAALATPAIDVVMTRRQERMEKRRTEKELIVRMKDKLTDTQFRRLWMYGAEGKTLEEIAAHEGVSFQSVHESIEGAKKKIYKKF